MKSQQYNDAVRVISAKVGRDLLDVLDVVKDRIADARIGDYSTESRRGAIEAIDKELYNAVSKIVYPTENKTTNGSDSMI